MAANTRWTRLNWEDPFELDAQLTEEQRIVRDSARQYAQQALAPRVKKAFRTETNDPIIFREMGLLGCPNNARSGIACGALGAVEACWRTARQNTLDRRIRSKSRCRFGIHA